MEYQLGLFFFLFFPAPHAQHGFASYQQLQCFRSFRLGQGVSQLRGMGYASSQSVARRSACEQSQPGCQSPCAVHMAM